MSGLNQLAAWYDLRRYGYALCIEVVKTTAMVKNLNNPPGFFRAQLRKGNPLAANADLYERNESEREREYMRYMGIH